MGRTATKGLDYTNRDYAAYRRLLIQKLVENMPEYTDTSSTDAGIRILEAFANGLDICSYYTDAIANDVVLVTTQDRRIACILARQLGYTPYPQTSSVIPMVFLLEEEQEEDVVIGRGTIITTEETEDLDAIPFETISDLIIPAGSIGNEQDEDGNYLYTVLARQGDLVDEDYIGSSAGVANQIFSLSNNDVILDTLELYVDEGDGEVLWERVDSFIDCGPSDRVYVATIDDYDTCYIEFGNNIKGKIPAIFDNGLRAVYYTGGGALGNVQSNTVTEIETEVAFVDSCFNLDPVIKGHNKESLEEIKYNAPANWRTRNRAVTLKDYEDLIKINVSSHDRFYEILNIKALQDKTDLLKVNLYYQMRDDVEMPEELIEEINEFLKEKVIVGTSYELFPYEKFLVDLKCSVVINEDYISEEVLKSMQEELQKFFEYGNQTFEDVICIPDLESEIRNAVKGLGSFRITNFTKDIQADSSNKIVTLREVEFTIL